MILVLNCGSQSIKWKLFDEKLKLEKQGSREIFNSQKYQFFLEEELKKIKNLRYDIRIVGHRVVHGGDKLRKPVKITAKILNEIEKFNNLAPLHNPYNILGIKTAEKIFPKVSQAAVFDTEFYVDLPLKAGIYPLSAKISNKYKIRRFGFHGISHEYAAKEGARKIGKPFRKLKIITCHLGGGSSVTAVKNGKAIDTSMGFTPMEGLMMMTRSGDIDPGIILNLAKHFSFEKVYEILNFNSGVKGISGSGNMLEILQRAKNKDKTAELALDMFIYKIQKYIGAYFAVLNGCDLLVFTGTIGFGSSKIRSRICRNLTILKNTKILSVKTNEELEIARKIKKMRILRC